MKKIFLFLLASLVFANTITYTKKKISHTKFAISKMNHKLDFIANEINKKQIFLNKINKKIDNLNKQIDILNKELNNSSTKLSEFTDLKKGFETKSQKIQNEIINFISENYFTSTSKTQNLQDLIDKEITKKILKRYSKKINLLIQKNKKMLNRIQILNTNINNIKQKQNILFKTKQKLAILKKNQKKELLSLNQEKKQYKKRLQTLIRKEENLQNRLVQLNIIKKRKALQIQRQMEAKKQNQNLNVNINVKKYGSLYFNTKTANYKGAKTIPPVKGTIIKKFGSYIDPVYKIKIYNDSITIKPYKPNSVVRAVLSGRIVYIGRSNSKKVVIIKHKNALFTIYANLDKVSPLLKKGLYVKKGQIIARINGNLEFEVTYKEKPINPTKVIALK